LGGIFSCGIFNLFACNSTTKRAMTKWRPWLDSARQIGPATTLMDLLIVVRGVITGGEEVWAEFFALRLVTLEMFTCTVQTILLGCVLILRLPVGLSHWFASHSSSCPQTLLFAWCNPHFPSNLAACPPVLWKVFPFNSHKATGSVSIS